MSACRALMWENGSVAAGRSPLLVSVEFQKIY
jgi:hypothetical protein